MKAAGIVPVSERRKAAIETVSAGGRIRPVSFSRGWRRAAVQAGVSEPRFAV